jgi:hypothetical protein
MALEADTAYKPAYDAAVKARKQKGGDVYLKTTADGAPLHTIMYHYMGLETFAVEWDERRDEILKLNDLMVAKQRDLFSVLSKSPIKVVGAGGNYSPEVWGKPRFVEYVLPHWEEAAGILHEGGKLLGSHLDAENGPWAEEIGSSALDWIEAFTPYPDTTMTVADARRLWAGRVMYINFPSSVHLRDAEGIREVTRQILAEAAPGDRFIIGVTENVPENRWRESFRIILDTCNEYGRLPIQV